MTDTLLPGPPHSITDRIKFKYSIRSVSVPSVKHALTHTHAEDFTIDSSL